MATAPAATRKSRRKTDTEPVETVEVSLDGKTIRAKQATVPTGIFPIPARIRRWAGLD